MRFGICLMLIIAAGAGIGLAIPTSESGGAQEMPGPVAASPGDGFEQNQPADVPGQASFSETRRVAAPVHFSYAVILLSLEKELLDRPKAPEEPMIKAEQVSDRSITITAKDAEGGALELRYLFAADGPGTRITTRVKATGEFASEVRKVAGDPGKRRKEFGRFIDEIDRAAAEIAARKPEWTLNQAADELLTAAASRRYDRETRFEPSGPPAENAAAAADYP